MKTDALKKHHFWIVAGVSLLMVLLTFVMLNGGVSEAIELDQGKITKAANEAKSAQAPGQVALNEIENQKKTLEKKKDDLWKENWENQKKFYTWPATSDNMFAEYNDLKFGEPLKGFDDFRADIFQRETIYKALYTQLAASIAPTRFAGGWQTVLGERYIASWGGKKPEARQLWLAMEDLWVERALLDPIRQVNEAAAAFKLVDPKAPPLQRVFVSPTWQIDLDVVTQGAGKLIKAKLKNRTPQMQLLGSGSAMTLKIWLDRSMDIPPVEFRIEGEYVAGESEIVVSTIPGHVVPAGVTVTEIAKVEQVLDDRTVPIREVAKLSLKLPIGRDAKVALLPPEFWKDEADAAAASGVPVAGGGQRGDPAFAGGDARPGVLPGAVGAGAGGASTLTASVDNNRKRYLEVTPQLRRMPVAIKLVLDQRHMQDVMVAYTNSPLRLQLTQYYWVRFRGVLSASDGTPSGTTTGPLAGAGGATDGPAIRGSVSADFGDPSRDPNRGDPGRSGFIPGLMGGALTNVSDAQANSSLIELYLFGIVTLYEKHEAKKDPNAPADVVPAVKVPMETAKP